MIGFANRVKDTIKELRVNAFHFINNQNTFSLFNAFYLVKDAIE